MNTIAYDQRDEGWEPYGEQPDEAQLPRRPRRQFFNKRSAALAAVVMCATGFYAGVRVEKGQLGNSSSSALTFPTGSASGRSATGAARSGAAGARGAGSGLAALFGGGGSAGGSSASLGTITSVKGSSLFVSDATGNVTKVKISSATKISKSLGVKRSALHPGDTVVIRGLKNSSGTLVATSVSDSGASASGTPTASSSGSASSAVGSLFGSGGSAAAGGSGGSGAAGGSGG